MRMFPAARRLSRLLPPLCICQHLLRKVESFHLLSSDIFLGLYKHSECAVIAMLAVCSVCKHTSSTA